MRNIFKRNATEEISLEKKFSNFPFGRTPLADEQTYLGIWEEAKARVYPLVDEWEKNYGYAINSDWLHELALHTQVVIKESKICYPHGRLLYTVIRDYVERNQASYINILETGTARGFSSLCMAKALEDSNVEAKILTFDILPHTISIYWNCIDDTEKPKTRQELLQNYQALIDRYLIFFHGDTRVYLPKAHVSRVHLAFLDGAHSYEDVLREFAHVKEKQMSGDVMFFDDYTEAKFPGIVSAVDEICDTYRYKKEVISANEERAYAIARKL